MGTNSGCNGDSRAVDCETTPGGMGLRPIVLELRMPFSPEAGGDGVPGMLDPRMVDGHAYVGALAREVLASAPDYADCQVQAVALTDGMAAHVADDALGALLRGVRQSFDLAPDAEVALRVRPGMVAAASMDAFRIGHVNRIVVDYATSLLGEWRALGRALDPGAMDVTHAVFGSQTERGRGIRSGGRETDLAFELLVGIPGQTPRSTAASVEATLKYGTCEVRLLLFAAREGSELAHMHAATGEEWRAQPENRIPAGEGLAQAHAAMEDTPGSPPFPYQHTFEQRLR